MVGQTEIEAKNDDERGLEMRRELDCFLKSIVVTSGHRFIVEDNHMY